MDDERLKQLVKLTGKSRLVLDLSCRKKVHYCSPSFLLFLSTSSFFTFPFSFYPNLLVCMATVWLSHYQISLGSTAFLQFSV